ncbi:MAG: CinA family protein, partial [Elusimicrobiota bacterium]
AVAGEMAVGASRAANSVCSIGITGIAGPAGGTPEKPVGTVFVAVSGPGRAATVRRLAVIGPRENVRSRAVTSALRLAYDALA